MRPKDGEPTWAGIAGDAISARERTIALERQDVKNPRAVCGPLAKNPDNTQTKALPDSGAPSDKAGQAGQFTKPGHLTHRGRRTKLYSRFRTSLNMAHSTNHGNSWYILIAPCIVHGTTTSRLPRKYPLSTALATRSAVIPRARVRAGRIILNSLPRMALAPKSVHTYPGHTVSTFTHEPANSTRAALPTAFMANFVPL